MYRLNETREDGMKLIPFCDGVFEEKDIPDTWTKIAFNKISKKYPGQDGIFPSKAYVKSLDLNHMVELYNRGYLFITVRPPRAFDLDEFCTVDRTLAVGTVEAIDDLYIYTTLIANALCDVYINNFGTDCLCVNTKCVIVHTENERSPKAFPTKTRLDRIAGWIVPKFNIKK